MENHPIPQNVTGFQFKLIGEMTIKQFAYLAGGIIFAWVSYAAPVFILIKLPFILLFAFSGFAFAFFPLEGRPLDIMVINYIRALFLPNQFIYQKMGRQFALATLPSPAIQAAKVAARVSQEDLQKILLRAQAEPKSKLDEKETIFLNSIVSIANAPIAKPIPQLRVSIRPTDEAIIASAIPRLSQSIPQLKTDAPLSPRENEKALAKEAMLLEHQLEQAKALETQPQHTPTGNPQEAHQKVLALERELQEVLSQKEQLEKQLLSLSQKLSAQQHTAYAPSTMPAQPVSTPKPTVNVRKIPQSMAAKIGLLNITDIPNLVTGIVKDPRGNVLPNILVEIKDKEGNPVRAFKTNNLGQFASATPLMNGDYTMTFEDPQNKQRFDTVALGVNGQVLLPLEVISTDQREDLRRELFGK